MQIPSWFSGCTYSQAIHQLPVIPQHRRGILWMKVNWLRGLLYLWHWPRAHMYLDKVVNLEVFESIFVLFLFLIFFLMVRWKKKKTKQIRYIHVSCRLCGNNEIVHFHLLQIKFADFIWFNIMYPNRGHLPWKLHCEYLFELRPLCRSPFNPAFLTLLCVLF